MSKKAPNLHTHTFFCDGKGSPEEYISAAIEKKTPSLGFSGHAPVPFKSNWNMSQENFDKYNKEIDYLKLKYKDKIEIYKGIESDYLKKIIRPDDYSKHKLDYIIGSIHYLSIKNVDAPWDFIISPSVFKKGLEKYYNNNINKLISEYFEAMAELSLNNSVDIIAHFNQINKFNKGNIFFNENDKFYLKKTEESLKIIAENNKIVEINTRGRFKNLSENFYPSPEILKICKDLKIKITLSSDAHSPSETDSLLNEAANYAYNAGYKEFVSLKTGKFETFPVSEYI